MNKFLTNLKAQAEDQPIVAIGVGVAVLTGLSAFVNAAANASSRRTWAKEVNRRSKKLK